LLGAGASADIIPMTHQQSPIIRERYLGRSGFPYEKSELDPVARRIVGSTTVFEHSIQNEQLARISSGGVYAISMQLMTPTNAVLKQPISQYEVFNFAKQKSVIFNFNLDGLTDLFCKNHYVFYPHGVLNYRKYQSKEWDQVIDVCFFYGIQPQIPPNVLLPQKEPINTSNRVEYLLARKLFPYTKYVVLIGYSFGFNGNDFDDWETFSFFKEICNIYKKTIIIVDLFNSKGLADMLREELKQNNIYEIAASWEFLSKAKLELERVKVLCPHDKDRRKFDLCYIYNMLCDRFM